MTQKISELTEITSVGGTDYIEVSQDDGSGGHQTRRWAPGTAANKNLAVDGGLVPTIDRENVWSVAQKLNLLTDYVDYNSEHDNGSVSSDTTIDWNNGDNQAITLAADIVISFSNMGVGDKKLRVVQDATGGRTPTLPTGKWPGGTVGSFSVSGEYEDILDIYYNGTDYYYQLTKGWA